MVLLTDVSVLELSSGGLLHNVPLRRRTPDSAFSVWDNIHNWWAAPWTTPHRSSAPTQRADPETRKRAVGLWGVTAGAPGRCNGHECYVFKTFSSQSMTNMRSGGPLSSVSLPEPLKCEPKSPSLVLRIVRRIVTGCALVGGGGFYVGAIHGHGRSNKILEQSVFIAPSDPRLSLLERVGQGRPLLSIDADASLRCLREYGSRQCWTWSDIASLRLQSWSAETFIQPWCVVFERRRENDYESWDPGCSLGFIGPVRSKTQDVEITTMTLQKDNANVVRIVN